MHVNSGDTAFILISAALVMFMTPGLALFYGGMTRGKNVLGTLMQSFFAIAVISVVWALFGFSLAFGPDKWHLIGSLKYIGLQGIGQAPLTAYAATIPALAFMIYQGMFAVITPALITGAFAERMKFTAFLIFIIFWSILVYAPIAHWVWGVGGWIRELGALDFAGGTVVHISSGAAALIAALLIGKRKGLDSENWVPHNLTMTVTGAAILWFGWFGFNAGSALTSGANGLFYGNAAQLGIEALAVAAVVIYSFVVSYILLKLIDAVIGLRVSAEEELIGLDLSQHSEVGYSLSE